MSEKTFVFTFQVSEQFLRRSPVASKYVDTCKARIAARPAAIGPRGGLYRLVSPPDEWRESRDAYDAFIRNEIVYGTTRRGRYVRPDRITPDLRLDGPLHFDTLTVAAVDGRVILPDGRTVTTESPFVSFPVLAPTPEDV